MVRTVAPVLAEMTDPEGRQVVLDEIASEHILFGHPAMRTAQLAIFATVERPDYREPDPVHGRERFYARPTDLGSWLRVVVNFSQVPGYWSLHFPRDERQGWSNQKR
jgi:hypothetical protein